MDALTLKVNEIFYSIQGESLLAGKPTAFVRTATCNLRCKWCDTRYSFWQGKLLTVPQILVEVKKLSPRYVCVTGGEPLGQRACVPLLRELLNEGYTVSLETNGSFSIKDVPLEVIKIVDVKCPGSGESAAMAWENLDLVRAQDQLKFVVASKEDFQWADSLCRERQLTEKCGVLFTPVQGKVTPAQLAAWILDSNAPVTMQTQMHKEIWGENQRGV